MTALGLSNLVDIGGVNADTVRLCVTDTNTPIMELYPSTANINVPLSLNTNKITNLGDATLATDAINRQTGDGRYYLNTTTLNNILDPTGDVTFNN